MLCASAAAVVTLVSGCSAAGSGEPSPGGTPTPEEPASASADPTQDRDTPRPEPTLDPEGSALQNRDYFDFVNERLLEEQEEPDGRAFVDSLIAAGFDREAMEVTPDQTAIDLPADNIQFAVRVGDECLLGQFGNTGYVSHIADVLSTGKCLVGRTRPIDW